MRVAMISDYYDADGKTDGGVQTVTKYLVDEMSRIDDLDLHLVMFKSGLSRAEQTRTGNHTRHVLPMSRFSAITWYARNQRELNACLDSVKPDIVHSQGAGSSGIMTARCGYPSVLTIHGIFAEEIKHISSFRRRMRHRLLAWQSERYCLRRSSHIIAISPYVAQYFGGRIAGKCHFIPNPTDARFFDVVRREEAGRILFAGRIVPLKGVMDLVHAVSGVDREMRPKVILAGAASDKEYAELVKSEVQRLGLESAVEFRGLLDGEALLSEFARCSCLVLPSYQENAPMVIQEAMASGLPVIASKIGGIPYQVEDGVTGFLVEPGDSNTLGERLSTLLSDDGLRESFAKAAKNKAEQEYVAANIVRQTIDIYKRIIGAAAGSDRI